MRKSTSSRMVQQSKLGAQSRKEKLYDEKVLIEYELSSDVKVEEM